MLHPENVQVYKEPDFVTDLDRVRKADKGLGFLMCIVDESPGARIPASRARKELLKDPVIARAMQRFAEERRPPTDAAHPSATPTPEEE